ncbi:uncharacterized protein H6S33_007680 [Morchella sextelata]|uniref:uncharacterized protein n=1 Tax=Morchella sextelata TaxID=1174677 RepID=UPI001D04C5F4|nr:uncharacterized protein H6S33_007680 [Morchella sextelata]KAH0603358.1 hypothetical protein H6S33_007680 [Morchella sextelata]
MDKTNIRAKIGEGSGCTIVPSKALGDNVAAAEKQVLFAGVEVFVPQVTVLDEYALRTEDLKPPEQVYGSDNAKNGSDKPSSCKNISGAGGAFETPARTHMKNNNSASRSGRPEIDTYLAEEGSKEEQVGGGDLGKLRFDNSISDQNQDGICTYSGPRIPRTQSTTFLQNSELQPKLNTWPFDTHTEIVNSNTQIQIPALSEDPNIQEKRRRPVNEYGSSSGAKNHSRKSNTVENVLGAKRTITDTQNDIEDSTRPTQASTISDNLKIQEKESSSLGASYINSDGRLNSSAYSSSKNILNLDSRKPGPIKPIFGAQNSFEIMEDTRFYIEDFHTRSQISTFSEGSKFPEKENKPFRETQGNSSLRHDLNKSSHVRNVLQAKDEFEITADTYSCIDDSNAPTQDATLFNEVNIQDRRITPADHIYGKSTIGHGFVKSSSEKIILEDNEEINAATCTIANTPSTPQAQNPSFSEKPNVEPRENQLLDETSSISSLERISARVDITTSQADEDPTNLEFQPKTIRHKEIYSNHIFVNSGSEENISASESISTPRISLPKVDISISRIYKSQLFSPQLGFRPQALSTLEEIYGNNESSFNSVGHTYSKLHATSQIHNSGFPSLGIIRSGAVESKSGNNGAKARTATFDFYTDIKNMNSTSQHARSLAQSHIEGGEFLTICESHGRDQPGSRVESPDPLNDLNKELELYAELSQHQSAASVSAASSKISANPVYHRFDVATSRPLTLTIQQQLAIQPKMIELLEGVFGKVSAELLIANNAPNVARLIASVDPVWLLLTSVDRRPLRVCDFPMAAWDQLVHRTILNVQELNNEQGIALNLTPTVNGLEESVLVNDRFSSCKAVWSRSNQHFPPPEQGGCRNNRERRYRSNDSLWGAPYESEISSISDSSSTVSSNLDISAIPTTVPTTLSASATPFIPRQASVQSSAQSTKKTRSRKPAEPHGRGILIKNLPPDLTLAELGTHLGGGPLERIDFHDGESRTVVGIYFISRDDAARYRDAVNQNRGICWGGGVVPGRSIHIPRSFVEVIPSRKGGHEPIKPNVVMAMESEGATRCIEITGLPSWINKEKLLAMISRQSKAIMPAVEYCVVGRDPMMRHLGLKAAVIRMASLGTALGARLCLRDRKGFNHIGFRFLPDPCQFVDLGLLIAKWDDADELDSKHRLLDSRAEMVRRRVHAQAGRRSGYHWY